MIKEIKLQRLLPDVFCGSESEPPVSESRVWLTEFTLRRGERYLIEAESGAGKSSLCAYLTGLRRDYQGRLLFDGKDARTFGTDRWCELRRVSLAYLPQELHLFPELSAIDNIRLKNRLTRHKTEEQIQEMLRQLGVADRADYPAGRLSVGQQQRVALVRALCQPFDFLLLDEPVSHLDEASNRAVAALIEREAEANGAAIVATSVGNRILLPEMNAMKL